jgi:dTDP-4-amino-4,6-dideoxygalactose transaminase
MATPHSIARQKMHIPMLDLGRQYGSIREEILQAVARVLESQHFVLSEEVTAFEREAATFIGTTAAIGCASGTDALWLALAACDVQPGDMVLTTPFSFFASASSIVRAGARPMFTDIDAATFNLDPVKAEARLQQITGTRLSSLMPVHLYGQCADMDAFRELAQEFKLALVEDAAQAFGATWRGARAGSLAAAAGFSFYPTKNLSAAGDAGCVTTADSAIADKVRSLRNHGSTQRYHHDEIGWNSRLDAMQAAVLRVKLKYVEKWNAQRRERAAEYHRMLSAAGVAERHVSEGAPVAVYPSSAAPVVLPHTAALASHIFHQYVVRVQRRDELRVFLADRGIGTEVYYPVPLHLQPALRYIGYTQGDFPEAERAAQEVLALPMFPELKADEQAYVVESIAEFYS